MKSSLISALLLFYSFSYSTIRNVPGGYLTIQSALNACLIGDTVLVQPGTYTENVYWPKTKNIKLFSAGDSSNTIIDANYSGRCLSIIDSSQTFIDTNTIISDFKLIHGYSDTSSFNGVAIYAYGSWPLIKKLAITNCNVNAINSVVTNTLTGGIIHLFDARAILKYTAIYNNIVYNSLGNINGGILFSATGTASSPLFKLNIYNNNVNVMVQNTNNGINGAIISSPYLFLDKVSIVNNIVNYFGTTSSSYFNGLLYQFQDGCSINSSLIANNTFSSSTNININTLAVNGPLPGALFPLNSSMKHVTIANNKAYTTGSINAISFYGLPGASMGFGSFYKHYNFYNCIFYNPFNSSANELNAFSTSYTSWNTNFSIVRNFASLLPINPSTLNPVFVSANDFHLQLSSPAINSGYISSALPNSDIDFTSVSSPSISFPDFGCYEISQPTNTLLLNTSISSGTICP